MKTILWSDGVVGKSGFSGKLGRRMLLALCGLGVLGALAAGVQRKATASCTVPSISSVTAPSTISPNNQYSVRVYINNSASGYLLRLNEQLINNGDIIGGSINLTGSETYVDIPFSTGQNKGSGLVNLPIEVTDSCYITIYDTDDQAQALWAD